ncbi:MAG: sigma-54-dependent Fis family transcriptional regulator [Deltaproteobacteria bacterium]|nr:sigma-54-dependent Fis family transcriptional regulator [Deltaproteobacteria bacterium]
MATDPACLPPLVLIADDHHRALHPLQHCIPAESFRVIWTGDEGEAAQILRARAREVKIIITDLKVRGMGSAAILHLARRVAPAAAVLVTAPLGPFLSCDGAFYDLSGINLRREIGGVLRGILQRMEGERVAVSRRGRRGQLRARMGVLIGQSRAINGVYRVIDDLQGSSATVLLYGESGTGKELVAQTIHRTSARKEGPFVAINCGAIPSSLMETELFGHERGAFTSAVSQRKGKFEVAHGGTLFLDEIGDMEKDLQVKLLRVLQEREFQRVGGNVTLRADVRVIAASSRDLREAAAAGHFREDLFYRLNVVPISLPPLRERREDIPLLLDHYADKLSLEAGRPRPLFSPDARRALERYRFPGNVRELANLVERLLVLCSDGQIEWEDLPSEVRGEVSTPPSPGDLLRCLPTAGARLEEVERELIVKTLEHTCGNKVAAAAMLGVTRRLLYLRLSQYGLAAASRVSRPGAPDEPECHVR